MELFLDGEELRLHLGAAEKVLAFRFRPLVFRREQVLRAYRELPTSSWRDLRAPGTALPGFVKAGTYYTPRGKEFWFVRFRDSRHALCVELDKVSYKRLVLTLANDAMLEREINDWAAAPR